MKSNEELLKSVGIDPSKPRRYISNEELRKKAESMSKPLSKGDFDPSTNGTPITHGERG